MCIDSPFGTSRREMSKPSTFQHMTPYEKPLRCSSKVDYRCCHLHPISKQDFTANALATQQFVRETGLLD
jgi:hypothetical protein